MLGLIGSQSHLRQWRTAYSKWQSNSGEQVLQARLQGKNISLWPKIIDKELLRFSLNPAVTEWVCNGVYVFEIDVVEGSSKMREISVTSYGMPSCSKEPPGFDLTFGNCLHFLFDCVVRPPTLLKPYNVPML